MACPQSDVLVRFVLPFLDAATIAIAVTHSADKVSQAQQDLLLANLEMRLSLYVCLPRWGVYQEAEMGTSTHIIVSAECDDTQPSYSA